MSRVPMVNRFNLGEVNAIRKAFGKAGRGSAALEIDWQCQSTGDAVLVLAAGGGKPLLRFVKYDSLYRMLQGSSSQVLAEGVDLLELIQAAAGFPLQGEG